MRRVFDNSRNLRQETDVMQSAIAPGAAIAAAGFALLPRTTLHAEAPDSIEVCHIQKIYW